MHSFGEIKEKVCAQPDARTNTINLKFSISMFYTVLKTIATYRKVKNSVQNKKTGKGHTQVPFRVKRPVKVTQTQ
jgi:hypothetical protein